MNAAVEFVCPPQYFGGSYAPVIAHVYTHDKEFGVKRTVAHYGNPMQCEPVQRQVTFELRWVAFTRISRRSGNQTMADTARLPWCD